MDEIDTNKELKRIRGILEDVQLDLEELLDQEERRFEEMTPEGQQSEKGKELFNLTCELDSALGTLDETIESIIALIDEE